MEKNSNSTLWFILSVSVVLYLIQLIQFLTGYDFSTFGIYPRSFSGIKGIIFSPFLHGSFGHLSSNLLVLAIGIFILFEFYKQWAWEVLLWIWIVGGLMVWAFGRESYHLGSSGLIYGINFFIFTSGILLQNFKTISLALVIILMNQGMFWGIVPVDAPVSWEGHFYSAVVGISLAFHLKKEIHQTLFPKQNDDTTELPEEVWNYPQNFYHQERLEE